MHYDVKDKQTGEKLDSFTNYPSARYFVKKLLERIDESLKDDYHVFQSTNKPGNPFEIVEVRSAFAA